MVLAILDYIEAHNTRLLQLNAAVETPAGLLVPYGPKLTVPRNLPERTAVFYEYLEVMIIIIKEIQTMLLSHLCL